MNTVLQCSYELKMMISSSCSYSYNCLVNTDHLHKFELQRVLSFKNKIS